MLGSDCQAVTRAFRVRAQKDFLMISIVLAQREVFLAFC